MRRAVPEQPLGVVRLRASGPMGGVTVERGVQRLGPAAGRENEIRPRFVAVIVGDEPLEHEVG